METFGKKLKQMRSERSMTLQQVADGMGVSRYEVDKWECDRVVPTPAQADALAQFFGVSEDVLIAILPVATKVKRRPETTSNDTTDTAETVDDSDTTDTASDTTDTAASVDDSDATDTDSDIAEAIDGGDTTDTVDDVWDIDGQTDVSSETEPKTEPETYIWENDLTPQDKSDNVKRDYTFRICFNCKKRYYRYPLKTPMNGFICPTCEQRRVEHEIEKCYFDINLILASKNTSHKGSLIAGIIGGGISAFIFLMLSLNNPFGLLRFFLVPLIGYMFYTGVYCIAFRPKNGAFPRPIFDEMESSEKTDDTSKSISYIVIALAFLAIGCVYFWCLKSDINAALIDKHKEKVRLQEKAQSLQQAKSRFSTIRQ